MPLNDHIMTKPLAFIRRDFFNEASYKFSFLTHFIGIVFSASSLYFLSRLVGEAALPHLSQYGGDYLSFVMIGVALAGYMQVSLGVFAGSMREAQTTGTLEAMLTTRTSVSVIILSSSLYSFLATSVRIIVYLLFGMIAFGIRMNQSNYLGAGLILCLTILCFSGVGILSASFIMVLKKGDPFNWLFTGLSWLLGGIYYPVSVFPEWLQQVAFFFPITHSLEGMRLALLQGYSVAALMPNIIALAVFGLVVTPVSVLGFQYAVRAAKINGSLTQY